MADAADATLRLSSREPHLRGKPLGRLSIHAEVLQEVRAAASRSRGGAEWGGLLVGTALPRDGRVEVVVQSARLTPSNDRSSGHFTFKPEAVEEVRTDARAAGLRIVGWFHTHPAGEPFMSNMDIGVQKADFYEAWNVSIVGSVASSGPLIGIWHLQDKGLLVEVTEYETVVSRGLEDERRDAHARSPGVLDPTSGSWTPPLLGAALAIVDGTDAMTKALQTKFSGASPAEHWRLAIASLAAGDVSSEVATSLDPDKIGFLDRAGLVTGGQPLITRRLPLAGESDLADAVLYALDRSRSGVFLIFLEENVARAVVVPLDCYPWADISVCGDSAWLISTKGEVVKLDGLRGCLNGETFTASLVDIVSVGEDPRICAVADGCAVMAGPAGRREMLIICTKASPAGRPTPFEEAVVARWGDTLATAPRELASRWALMSLDGGELASWDVPRQLSRLQVSHVSALGSRVVLVCDDPSNRVGVVLELELGSSRPVAFWLRAAGGSLGRAFPAATSSTRVVYVDDRAAVSLHPGCGG